MKRYVAITSVIFVLSFFTGAIVQAENEVYPRDPFPWKITKYHWSKKGAKNSAINYANDRCRLYDLVRDKDRDSLTTASTSLNCGGRSCKAATLRYYCERPKQTRETRTFYNVSGELLCTDPRLLDVGKPMDLPSYLSLVEASEDICYSLSGSGWFVDEITITHRGTVATGSCFELSDPKWDVRDKVIYKGNVDCSRIR